MSDENNETPTSTQPVFGTRDADGSLRLSPQEQKRMHDHYYAEARRTIGNKRAEQAPPAAVIDANTIAQVVAQTMAAMQAQQPLPTQGAMTPPVSTAPIKTPQLGAPAPGDHLARDPEAILMSRPLDATQADFERLVAKHGHEKATTLWHTNINEYLKTVKLVPDNRRRG